MKTITEILKNCAEKIEKNSIKTSNTISNKIVDFASDRDSYNSSRKNEVESLLGSHHNRMVRAFG